MTPKVGDKFKITKSDFPGDAHTEGGIVTYVRNGICYGLGRFRAVSGIELTFAYEGNRNYPCRVVPVTATLKDPIEYLKSAHANGDMICPATMLRECYGITKTDRVITEWSDVKQDIKIGDKVKIVGPASYTDQSSLLGEIRKVGRIDWHSTEARYEIECYDDGRSFWFPETSVELV